MYMLHCFQCGSNTDHDPQVQNPRCASCGFAYGAPIQGSSSIAYAHKKDGRWKDIHLSEVAVRMHDYDKSNPIYRVRVSLSPEGSYWAWWDHQKQQFTLVYPSEVQIRVCFPYGPEAEERRGRGLVCRVEIVEEPNN